METVFRWYLIRAEVRPVYIKTIIYNFCFLFICFYTNFLDQFNSYGVSKNSEIYFICKSGARSMHAALILESNGYQNLYNVEDGFVIGWKPSGLPSK